MCFSAPASFTAAGFLGVVGAATLLRARTARQIPLASFPLLFAVQQVIEGLVWLALPDGAQEDVQSLAVLFVLLGEVLWPVLVPAAILPLEPEPWRRRVLAACLLAGAWVAAACLQAVIEHPQSASIVGCSIRYANDFPYFSGWPALYGLSALAPLFSSHRPVRLFGVLLLAGYAVSAYAYARTLTSVWCFFAALASLVLLFQFARVPKPLPV